MALMLSVRFVSKERNCFPLFVKPLISDPAAIKIFSWGVWRTPPSSSLAIFCPGKVLNTACKIHWTKNQEHRFIVSIFLYCKKCCDFKLTKMIVWRSKSPCCERACKGPHSKELWGPRDAESRPWLTDSNRWGPQFSKSRKVESADNHVSLECGSQLLKRTDPVWHLHTAIIPRTCEIIKVFCSKPLRLR